MVAMAIREFNLNGTTLTAAFPKRYDVSCDIVLGPDGQFKMRPSIDVELHRVLEERFNFRTRVISSYGDYGQLVDDDDDDDDGGGRRWSGLMGLVLNGTADLGICGVANTYDRYEYVAFSSAIHSEDFTYMSLRPGLRSKWSLVARPFTGPLWLLIIAIIVILPFFNSLVVDPSGRLRIDRFGRWLYQSIAHLLLQEFAHFTGGLDNFRKKLLSIIWLFSCIILASGYLGIFYYILTTVEYDAPIDSNEQLMALAESDCGNIITIGQSSFETRFRRAPMSNVLYHSIGAHMNRTRAPMATTNEETLRILAASTWQCPTVFVSVRLHIEVLQTMARGQFHVATDSLSSERLSMIFPRTSALFAPFNHVVDRVLETGLVNHWRQDSLRKMAKLSMERWKFLDVDCNTNTNHHNQNRFEPLAASSLVSVFLVWLFGLLLATAVFGLEIGFFLFGR